MTVVLLLLLLSFALNFNYYRQDPVLSFYAPYTRFWELMAGIVLSALARNNYNSDQLKSRLEKIWTFVWSQDQSSIYRPNLDNTLSWTGVLLLVVSVFTVDGSAFPG